MKLPFYVDIRPNHSGVTGSCFYVKVVFPDRSRYSFLIDCGMFQGKYESALNDVLLPSFLKGAGTLILTHNHVDHIGRVPELIRNGFQGKIVTSKYTYGLLDKSWQDCLKIEKINSAKEKRMPRFKQLHVTLALKHTIGVQYEEKFQIHPNIWITLIPNGHVFGSAMIVVEIEAGVPGYNPINFLFTGDYNDKNYFFSVPQIPYEIRRKPLHIICEATYGEESRQRDRRIVFEQNIIEQVNLGKVIFIPTFAFERGQLVLSNLRRMQDSGKLGIEVPIYLEGRLLKEYTNHYIWLSKTYFDKVNSDEILPINASWITKPAQRDAILSNNECKIIVASGGMISFGPSQSYINSIISNPNAVIHFTGYQCEGTVGGNIKLASESKGLVLLRGKMVKVEPLVYHTEEFSSHALLDGLLQLIEQFPNRRTISLNHGNQEAKQNFAKRIILSGMSKEVGILSRDNSYRFSPYKLEKVVPVQ